jgi:hypothetical protein
MHLKTEFVIKHNDIDVCTISFTNDFRIERVNSIFNFDHLPPYILHSSEKNTYKFDEWFSGRAISNNREGLQDILKKYNADNTRELLLKNYALSLYDHYWICPEDKNIKWKDINFFENKFKEDVGNILVGDFSANVIGGITPESTSGGMLPKKWAWREEATWLIKLGSGYYKQEPFNEVIASKIMRRLGINCVDYALEWKGEEPRCSCANMLDGTNELIHAWDIVHEIKINDDKYSSFLKLTKSAGIHNVQQELNKILVLDYIIANTDRHFNNIGFLRDSRSLQYSGIAPVYDSGTSLWHDKDEDEIREEKECKSKPFKSHHKDQIKKVKDLGWLNVKLLSGIDEIVHETLGKNNKINKNKIFAITGKIQKRIKNIERLSYDLSDSQKHDSFER